MKLLPRLLAPLLESLLQSTSVVILEGGRANGKSTLCDELIRRPGWSPRVDFSDQSTQETFRLDPLRFLRNLPSPCFIDEAQLEPTITVAVKRVVDERRVPGQFVLTGSARLGRDALGGSDPLAGRAVRLRLMSLTQSELQQQTNGFIDRAFGSGWIHWRPSQPRIANHGSVVCRELTGCFPVI